MVKTKTDGKNVTITFEYDIMGSLKKVLDALRVSL
jgi:hypothetical protein